MSLMVVTTAATLLVAAVMLYLQENMRFTASMRELGPKIEQVVTRELRGLADKPSDADIKVAANNLLETLQNIEATSVDRSARLVAFQALNFNNQTLLLARVPPGGKTNVLDDSPWRADVPELVQQHKQAKADRFVGGFYEASFPIVPKASHSSGIVFVRYDLSESMQRQRDFLATAVIVILISLLTGWLLSSRLETFITHPITQLAQTMLRVTAVKDYTPRLRHQRNDEIGDLIDGFNSMLAQVEQRDAELSAAQQELEQRVLERTKELRQEVVERRRAQKDLSQQLARISLLNQITQAIANRQDLESILSVVLGELTLHLPADFGCALLAGADATVLRVACCRERELDTSYLAWKVENWEIPVAGSGWETPDSGPVFVEGDLQASDRSVFGRPAQLGMQAAGALPLRHEGRLTGLLIVARRSSGGFSQGEQEFLRALAEHVALASQQVRLYSDLQKAYNELRQTQQAVMQHERLRALGQMASGVAHDINNALSPVSGFAELLLTNEPNLSDNARKYLGFIKTASDDIAHIVSRLREFYRNRDEEQPLLPLDLESLATQVVELTRPRWRDLAQRRGVDVQVLTDFEPGTPRILGIETELREALTNLVFNALDAMPAGGTIAIRTRKLVRPSPGIGADQPDNVVVEVIDSGMGMDEETRKRCLEPFFSTKGKRGTGLGLAMVYGTVQRHNGSIEVESERGRGTTMRLVFPAFTGTVAAELSSAETQPTLRALRVLFVDDEPLLRELIREILEAEGHTVVTADGGPEGLDRFRKLRLEGQPPDVVITDLGMPQIDGRELTRRIKQESPETPVILMTGWGKMMRGQDEIRAPVDALVSKPPRMAELLEALLRVVPPRSSGAPATPAPTGPAPSASA